MRARDYAGHDPHDLLRSPLVRRLCFGSRWLAVAWTQLGKRSPLQLRQFLGVRPARNAKGIGLTLAAYVRLHVATTDPRFRDGARALTDWLGTHAAPGTGGWGYPFPWANRDFHAPAGTPSSVVTAFVGHALLDAADAYGWADARDRAAEGGEFIRRSLVRISGPDALFCFSYTPLDRRGVHNANLLAASLLARLAAVTGDPGVAGDALRAARFSARAQQADGSWPYGIGARNTWVDSFHTGYNLVALEGIGRWLATDEFDAVVERGTGFWRREFFRGPAVGFHAGSAYPVDTHAVAHAILALVALRDRVPDALATAGALADWCLHEMRDAAGFFYYTRHRMYRNRIPYMRWVQAWMLRALAELAGAGASIGATTGSGEGG